MPSLEILQRQLKGAEELQAIVRAMKGISAARVRQFRGAVESLRDYAHTLELGLQATLRDRPEVAWPVPGPLAPRVVVLFGADRGLAGQFNARLIEFARGELSRRPSAPRHVFAVGGRMVRHVEAQRWRVDEAFPAPGSVEGVAEVVQDLLVAIRAWREERRVERFTLMYHDYAGGASYAPRRVELLPVDARWLARLRQTPWTGPSLPAYRGDWDAVFARLLREHLFIALYRACAESMASENASRLAAMLAAETRIDERLGELQHRVQQERQQAVTQELLEMLAGVDVLGGGDSSRRAGSWSAAPGVDAVARQHAGRGE